MLQPLELLYFFTAPILYFSTSESCFTQRNQILMHLIVCAIILFPCCTLSFRGHFHYFSKQIQCLTLCSSLTVFNELLEDIISAENESAYLVLGFSTGYFIHDIYHNYCSGICLRSAEIIIHHITVVTCFAIVITCRLLLPYALFGLLMELNSIFLHGRQIMLYLNVNPNSLIYRMNANANVGSFVVFRIFLTIGLDYWAVSNRHRLPGIISAILITSFVVFTVMNFVLFFRVLASEKRILREYNKRRMTDQPYSNGTVRCCDNVVKTTKSH
ncbi:hypothetical protein D915_001705 [Fasciola hepatica]|uniref:TLC domain-containing protein n=1 Tax=Fasciola hepatica TaxID=6192 RepID=A0A4E0RYQ3_FASHE|nr:hypothetical protein D915_001705 [Fasciola hepatica]